MMKPDLIERAEKVRDKLDARGDARTLAGKLDTPDTRVITDAQNIINELITALSPTLPDDVTEIISQLNKVTNKQPNVIANATATLGRQQQRIDELEAKVTALEAEKEKDTENRRLISMVVDSFTDENKARIRAALEENSNE